MTLNPSNSSSLELALKGLICRTYQLYCRQRLTNTEWSNSNRSAWARDRRLWMERFWEKEGFKTRVKNATRNVNKWTRLLTVNTLQFRLYFSIHTTADHCNKTALISHIGFELDFTIHRRASQYFIANNDTSDLRIKFNDPDLQPSWLLGEL